MERPNPLRDLGEILKTAAKLEIGTPAGRVNALGMLFALVFDIAANATTLVEDIIRIFRPKAVASPTDFSQLFIIFVILIMFCVLIVALDNSKRQEPPTR